MIDVLLSTISNLKNFATPPIPAMAHVLTLLVNLAFRPKSGFKNKLFGRRHTARLHMREKLRFLKRIRQLK